MKEKQTENLKSYKEILNKKDPFDRQILKSVKDGTLKVGVVGIKEKTKQ